MKLYRAEYKYLENDDVKKDYMDFVGKDFFSVLTTITGQLNELDTCELTGIFELLINNKSTNIVNFTEPDCNCPYCRASRVPLDMVARFPCPNCGTETVVAENGWEVISCNSCSGDLYRNLLLRSKDDGNWYYTKEQDEEED